MFKFNRTGVGAVYQRGGVGVASMQRHSGRMVTAADALVPGAGVPNVPSYNANRYNPVWDRLEQGAVYEDWVPRNNSGINMMYRRLYARDAIAGPSIDIWCNIPWSSFDIVGVEDPAIRKFYEDAFNWWNMDLLGQVSREFLVLGRFAGSLIYDESRGYWNGLVPHDPDFLEITPIPVRGFDPKLDLLLSPGLRRFLSSDDERDIRARLTIPNSMLEKFISQGKAPLDPLSTLYLARKTSPYDFIGCVTGDTLVSTDHGLIPIGELPFTIPSKDTDRNILGAEAVKEISVQVPALGSEDTATLWVDKGEQPVTKIRTDDGYEIEATYDHPIRVLDTNTMSMVWKNAKDITLGDFVAINRSGIWPKNPVSFDFSCWKNPSKRGDIKTYDVPSHMTQELALLLGYLVSEGYIREDRIQFSNKDPEVKTDFLRALNSCFPNYTPSISKPRANGLQTFDISSAYIVRFFHHIGLTPALAHDKVVPWSILRSQKEHVSAYMSAYFEGDGASRQDEVCVVSSSETLLKQTQVLLLGFGITSYRKYKTLSELLADNDRRVMNGYKNHNMVPRHGSGVLTVNGYDFDIFCKEIGMRSSTKTAKMESRPYRRSIRHVIPGLSAYVKNLFAERRVTKDGLPTKKRNLYKNDSGDIIKLSGKFDGNNYHSYSTLKKYGTKTIAQVSLDLEKKVKDIIDTNFYWVQVCETVDSGTKRVYDLMVPSSHAFVSNGIVNHNTSLLTRVVPFWAIEKALTDAMTTAARRRAGNILHVQAGIDQLWEPTPEEINMISGLFLQADEDPTGAIVVTRNGLQVQEVRQGGQIWKLSDEFEFLTKGKMRALGINESFLDGQATYNNVEAAKSVFVEQIVNFRHTLTHQIFTRKAEILARAHGFRKLSKAQLDHRIRPSGDAQTNPEELRRRLKFKNLPYEESFKIPVDELVLPTIHWHKELKPNQDEKFVDMLEKLEDKLGFKLPIRIWTASTGISLDDLVAMLPEDKKLREQIAKIVGTGEEGKEGGKEGGGEEGGMPSDLGGIKEHSELMPEASVKLDALPIWKEDSFLNLRRGEAKACLDRLYANKDEVRRNPNAVSEIVTSMFGTNTDKRDNMNYLLMRIGVGKKLPMTDKSFKATATAICNSSLEFPKVAQELSLLGTFVSSENASKVDAGELQKTWDKSADRLVNSLNNRSDIQAQQVVSQLKAEKEIAPTSPSLLSGSAD